MKTQPLLIFLFCHAFLFSSCVFSQVKELKSQNADLIQENQSLKKDSLVKENELAKFTFKVDSLSDEVKIIKRTSNSELWDLVDSLKDVLTHKETLLKESFYKNQHLTDTNRVLKSKLSLLYKLPGNEAKQVNYNNNTYDCYIVDIKKSDIQFYWKDDKNKPLLSLNNLAVLTESRQKVLVFATNAGMYLSNHAPQGLFIQNGKSLVPIDRRKEEYGNFYMQPNGVFLIDSSNVAKILKTDQFDDNMAKKVKFATQSGPMVVESGKVNQKFKINSNNLNIRSGVGIIDSDHVVFVISNQQVNFYDFANVFKEEFNCSDALYLDGAISEMYLPELGRFEDGGNFGPIIGITKKL